MGKKAIKTEKEKQQIEVKKRSDFVRLFEKRVNKAIKAVRMVGFCSGASYIYTMEQANQGILAIGNELKTVADKFQKKPKSVDTGFKLSMPTPK